MANFVVLNDESNVLGVIQGITCLTSLHRKLSMLITNEVLCNKSTANVLWILGIDNYSEAREVKLSFEGLLTGGTMQVNVKYERYIPGGKVIEHNAALFISKTYIY